MNCTQIGSVMDVRWNGIFANCWRMVQGSLCLTICNQFVGALMSCFEWEINGIEIIDKIVDEEQIL
jgi:hypothetical protein